MKKFGTLLLTLLLCFTMIGCSKSKTTADITKTLEKAGYTISYKNKDLDEGINDNSVTIVKNKDGKLDTQFIYYITDNKIEATAFIQAPKKDTDYKNMVIGFIYTDKSNSAPVNEDAKKTADKIFKELKLTNDDLIKYSLDLHKEKTKSTKK